ncbi:hypothetical protein ACQY0O_002034 [Thecaphora frezii]
MHTSGSLGLLKPIYQPHRFWTQSLATAAGTDLAAFTTTPLFHGGMPDFLRSLQAGSTIFFHPSAAPGALTAKAIVDAAAACPEEVAYFLLVPYILKLLYTDRQGLGREFLRPMQLVSTGEHHTWRYAARSDDTLVLVSGKKTTAPLIETKLRSSDLVAEAIAFGANRAIIGALVFLATPEKDEDLTLEARRAILTQLRPVVDSYNRVAPPHAQLAIEMVHLLPSSALAGIPRASKGSLQRGQAYQQYEPLIARTYNDFEEGRSISADASGRPGSGYGKRALTGDELVGWLIATIEKLREGAGEDDGRTAKAKLIRHNTDLFVAGIDSIQAARIRAAIHQNVELNRRLLQKNVVYDYPTPHLLADFIQEYRDAAKEAGVSAAELRDRSDEKQHRLMLDLVERYSAFDAAAEAQASPSSAANEATGGTLYILTGVTGALGAHLFDQLRSRLVAATDVSGPGNDASSTIVCLVRANDDEHARSRVLSSLQARQLRSSVEYVQGATPLSVWPPTWRRPTVASPRSSCGDCRPLRAGRNHPRGVGGQLCRIAAELRGGADHGPVQSRPAPPLPGQRRRRGPPLVAPVLLFVGGVHPGLPSRPRQQHRRSIDR